MEKLKKYYPILFLLLICLNILTLSIVITNSSSEKSSKTFNYDILSKAYSSSSNMARRTIVVDVAEKINPSIASVGAEITGYVRALNPDFFDFFSPFMSPYQLYQYKERVPFLGSGVIIDSNGYILTNYHVVEGKNEVFITLTDGREFKGKILDADMVVDIALIKIDGTKLVPAVLGNSDECLIGETVIAVGNPFGNLIEDPRPTVTSGVISALHRNFNLDPQSGRVYQDMIQTDAAINPGNSGGPLVNMDGEVIGINSFIMSKTGASHGIGFAIPINRAKTVATEIMTYGKIRPLWLDFEFTNLTKDIAKILGVTSLEGALVTNVQKNGPAFKAGISPGDIIVKANDRIIRNRDDLRNYYITKQVGDKITFEVLRGKESLKIDYVIQEFKQK